MWCRPLQDFGATTPTPSEPGERQQRVETESIVPRGVVQSLKRATASEARHSEVIGLKPELSVSSAAICKHLQSSATVSLNFFNSWNTCQRSTWFLCQEMHEHPLQTGSFRTFSAQNLLE